MTVKLHITGGERVMRTVKAVEKSADEAALSAPEKLAKLLQQYLVEESPVWSGVLKKSWRRIRSKRNAWRVQSTEYKYLTPYKLGGPMIKPRKSYALYPQIGTSTTKPGSVGYADRAIDRVETHLKNVLAQPIDKAMRR